MEHLEHYVFWAPWDGVGLESLHLVQQSSRILVQSVIIGVHEGLPFHLSYEIGCDRQWKMRDVSLKLLHHEHSITLETDGEGNWIDGFGQPIPDLAGCFEVDISVTPFTNTLPIQRLALSPGDSQDITVAYLSVPQMQVQPVQQCYTCLSVDPEKSLYRYEDKGLHSGFKVDLPVDSHGLVLEYPEIFRRVQI